MIFIDFSFFYLLRDKNGIILIVNVVQRFTESKFIYLGDDEDYDETDIPKHDAVPNLKLVMNPEGNFRKINFLNSFFFSKLAWAYCLRIKDQKKAEFLFCNWD